jgi:hypothetical protein
VALFSIACAQNHVPLVARKYYIPPLELSTMGSPILHLRSKDKEERRRRNLFGRTQHQKYSGPRYNLRWVHAYNAKARSGWWPACVLFTRNVRVECDDACARVGELADQISSRRLLVRYYQLTSKYFHVLTTKHAPSCPSASI